MTVDTELNNKLTNRLDQNKVLCQNKCKDGTIRC